MKALTADHRPVLFLTFLLLVMIATTAVAKDDDHGYLGVMLQNVTNSMAKALQLDEGEGVMINKVVADGPAAASGLEDGDVILKFAGESINDHGDLTKAVRATAPGDQVAIEILHNGKRQTVSVEMGKSEKRSYSFTIKSDGDDKDVAFFNDGKSAGRANVWVDSDDEHRVIVMSGDGEGDFEWIGEHGGINPMHLKHLSVDRDRGYMGVELDDLNEQLGEFFGVDDGEGALVSHVREDTPAADAGLRAGDVIVDIDGEEVEDSGDVYGAMVGTKPDQEVAVQIVRKGKKKTLKVTLGEMPEGSFGPTVIDRFDHDFDFPEGFDHDVRIVSPRGLHKIREIQKVHEDDSELEEVREELDKLRKDLKKLKSELKK